MSLLKNRSISRAARTIAAGALAVMIMIGCAGAASGSRAAATSASGALVTTQQTATTQPAGTPPAPPSGGPAGAPPSQGATTRPSTAAYLQNGGTATRTNQAFAASSADESAILVSDGGTLAVSGSTITTTGETSSNDSSSFYGLNAAVVAASGSAISLSDSSILTTGAGANGAFATGTGSSVALSHVTIKASGDGGHGIMATFGGTVTLTDVNISTTNAHAAPIATDRGSGSVIATGGTYSASGQDSPAIYSTGVFRISGGTYLATGAEAAVIEGANSIALTDASLSTTKQGKWGVMIYQSMSGDAEGTTGTFTMNGGSLSLTSSTGPLFYVTNSKGSITLKGVEVTVGSGLLVRAAAGTWGRSGSNGGNAELTADGQVLSGALSADALSSISLTLRNSSSLTGSVNAEKTAKSADIALDATSSWTVTADSHVTHLSDAAGISGATVVNIVGNGHTVFYDPASNSSLGGKTYSLRGGGFLKPAA